MINEKSWVEVIKKHEILRTGFFVNEDDSKLCQVVWNIQNTNSAWKFSRINDITEIDQGVAQDLKDIESTLMKFIPPIRLSLYQLEQDYYLAFTLHHSLYDGWSLPLILEDVQSYYHSSTLPSRPKFREVVEYICSDDIENLSEVSGPCFKTVPTIVKMDKNLSDSQLISNIHQNNLQVLEHLHTPLSSIN